MSKDEFVEKHFHELYGFVADALRSDRTGGELSMWLKLRRERLLTMLRLAYDDLIPPNRPEQEPPRPANVSPMRPPGTTPAGGK